MTTLDENLPVGAAELRTGAPGRGVLEGAFILLDVLAQYEDGAGLSELARATDLPKATTHRLVKQLVVLGAVERHGRRYFVGRLLGRLGASWRPNPNLYQAATGPVTTLAARSKSAVAVSMLHDGELKLLTSASGARSPAVYGLPASGGLAERTAAGQVLFDADAAGAYDRGPAWQGGGSPMGDWADRLVADRQDVLPGVCCVATAVCSPGGLPVAAISALTLGTAVPRGLGDLVRQASWSITRNLAGPLGAP